jgi:hypothetical protein
MFKASKFLAVLLAVMLGIPAWAQTPCPEEPQDSRKARAIYEEALVQEASGNLGAAREMYDRLVKDHAGTQFACWAQARLTALKSGKARVNKEGRATFIVGTTLFGAWAGYSLASMIYLDDSVDFDAYGKGVIWATIGGAAAGLVPAILVSGDLPMSTGRANIITFGWTWGAWHGLAFSMMPAPDLDPQVMFGLSLGLAALGWGGTFALTHYVDVADGDAALISASAGWATVFTVMLGVLISEDFFSDEDVFIPVLLGGGDAGLVAAALLTGKADMSAGRVGLISLGGMLGLLLSGGIMAVAEFDEYRPAVGMTLAITLGGLVGAYFLTTGYDDPGNGSTGLAALEYTPDGWAVGTPVPRLSPAYVAGQKVLTFEVPLIGGRF